MVAARHPRRDPRHGVAAPRTRGAHPGGARRPGLALAAIGSGWYAGLGAFLLAGAFALTGGARRVVPAILVGAVLLLPFAVFYQGLASASDGLVDIKDPEVLFRLRRTVGAADPLSFVMPGDFRSPDFARLEQNASDLVHTAYLGFVLVTLALWRGVDRRCGSGSCSAWCSRWGRCW